MASVYWDGTSVIWDGTSVAGDSSCCCTVPCTCPIDDWPDAALTYCLKFHITATVTEGGTTYPYYNKDVALTLIPKSGFEVPSCTWQPRAGNPCALYYYVLIQDTDMSAYHVVEFKQDDYTSGDHATFTCISGDSATLVQTVAEPGGIDGGSTWVLSYTASGSTTTWTGGGTGFNPSCPIASGNEWAQDDGTEPARMFGAFLSNGTGFKSNIPYDFAANDARITGVGPIGGMIGLGSTQVPFLVYLNNFGDPPCWWEFDITTQIGNSTDLAIGWMFMKNSGDDITGDYVLDNTHYSGQTNPMVQTFGGGTVYSTEITGITITAGEC